MEQRIRYVKEDAIISERPTFRHDCLAPEPFPRPPRTARPVTCRGCFNRCVLSPGQPGTCTVKRNIAGRITGVRLRVKAVVGGP